MRGQGDLSQTAASGSIRASNQRCSPKHVASALMRDSPPRVAFGIVRRELLAARRARSRSRFEFWSTVRDEISAIESIRPSGEAEAADTKVPRDTLPAGLSSNG